jgi:Domain of unknown function (DUF4177)
VSHTKTTWEYKVHEATITDRWTSRKQAEEIAAFEAKLNARGAEGWEVISYQAVPLTGSINASNIKGYAYIALLKRPK